MIALSAFFALSCFAQQPIEFVVKASPGGPDDIVTRKLVEELEKRSTLKFVVINKPGAAHQIGYNYFESRTTPSLIIADNNFTLHPAYQASREIFRLGEFTNIIYVKSKSDINTLEDLISLSKKREINFGHGGIGTYSHAAAEKICEKVLRCLLVPYKSGAPAMLDMLSGSIDAYSLISYGADVYMNNDSYRALMMFSNTKHPIYNVRILPQYMKNLEIKNWIAIYARNLSENDVTAIQKVLTQFDDKFFIEFGLWKTK